MGILNLAMHHGPMRHGPMHHGMSSMFSGMILFLMGIAVAALLYYGYKQWKNRNLSTASSSDAEYADFKNFEKEWKEIMSKHN